MADKQDLPLTPAVFYIMLALADGEKHGYAIMQGTRELSEDSFRMGPATLYTTIQRLLDSRWIAETSGESGTDSRRRYYRLTKDGRALLDLELARMESAIRKAKSMRANTAVSL